MNRNLKFVLLFTAFLGVSFLALHSHAQSSADFPPLQEWETAIISGNPAALKALYSTDPAAEVEADGQPSDANADARFWLALKARDIKIEIVRSKSRTDGQSIIFRASVDSATAGKTVTVTDAIAWQKQGDQWRIRAIERTDSPQLKQPSDMKKNIYPADADAHAEIKEAEEKAASAHKRLLLVFGANWCYDCHVLDLAFQRPDLAPVLQAGYEVVHIDLGDDEKKNADLVSQYQIPLNKGVPALAVAESDGKLVVSQKNGEFENARGLTPDALLAFLNKWKPSS